MDTDTESGSQYESDAAGDQEPAGGYLGGPEDFYSGAGYGLAGGGVEGGGAGYDPIAPIDHAFAPDPHVGPHHEHTAFGDYEVYSDTAALPCVLPGNAIRESEFHALETTWDNIHHGKGLAIKGTDADKAAFDTMLADGMQHSEAFRHTVEVIGNDTAHTEQINLGNHQPFTLVDNFASNTVDLDDLKQFPAAPRAGHHNETTRTELLDHVLEERHYAQEHDPNDIYAAHQHGIESQNHVRDELGQSHVVEQSHVKNADGSITADFHFANGDDEVLQVDQGVNITSVTPPNDH